MMSLMNISMAKRMNKQIREQTNEVLMCNV